MRSLLVTTLLLSLAVAAIGQVPTKASETPMLADIIENQIGMKLVKIRAGSFTIGSDFPGDGPPHQVQLTRDFFIGRCEVTHAQFAKVMGRNPSVYQQDRAPDPSMLAASERDDSFFANPDQAKSPDFYADLPVDSVTWHEAVEFCQKLSALESRKYRLPTEAEWEYACRAGTASTYSWGNEMDETCCNHASIFPIRVGRRTPNGWGLCDMLGNVCEWCSDWHAEYPAAAQKDPSGPAAGQQKVYRGGSFDMDIALNLRCSARFGMAPDKRLKDVGFRVVLEP